MDTTTNPQEVIRLRGLTKHYRSWRFSRRSTEALCGLDLTVDRGDVLGLVGPNGAGKTTTILLLLGLLPPTEGSVLLFGQPPGRAAVRARLGYLPEESSFYPFLSGRSTLRFYAGLFGMSGVKRRTRCDELLEFVGLTEAAGRPVGEYSKGMRRRLGLASSLVNDPELVVLDEPTSGLDPLGSRAVKDLIGSLKQQGKTVLLCSHNLSDVEDLCNRVAILDRGRLVEEGPLDELLAVQSRTLLEFENLSAEAARAAIAAATEVGAELVEQRPARRNLEARFLEAVRR